MKIIMNSVEQGDNLIMLVAPERLLIPEFNQALKSLFDGNIPLSLIVFDEAHCISEWGHDFRTSYLGIGERIKKLSDNEVKGLYGKNMQLVDESTLKIKTEEELKLKFN